MWWLGPTHTYPLMPLHASGTEDSWTGLVTHYWHSYLDACLYTCSPVCTWIWPALFCSSLTSCSEQVSLLLCSWKSFLHHLWLQQLLQKLPPGTGFASSAQLSYLSSQTPLYSAAASLTCNHSVTHVYSCIFTVCFVIWKSITIEIREHT